MKLKTGQIVHVRGTVLEPAASEGTVRVSFKGNYSRPCAYIHPSDIVHVEPVQLAVGDKVTWPAVDSIYDILAIHGDFAWLFNSSGAFLTQPLRGLERAP